MPLQLKAQSKSEDHHAADVNTLIYHEGKLYSGADDGKVIVWDKDLKKLKEIQAHPTTVYCLAVGNNALYSCSNDGTLLSWDLPTLSEKSRILHLDNEIYRLSFSDGVLYSSDDQGNIRSHKDHVVKGLYALLEPLRELIVQDKNIYTVRDLDLVITAIKGDKTYEVKHTFDGRAPMCIVGTKLCFSSRGGKDILIHEKSAPYGNVCELKDAHEMIINALTGTSKDGAEFLYSGGWDKTLKRWKIDNGSCTLYDSYNINEVINVMITGDGDTIYAGCGNGCVVRVDG